MQQQKKYTSLKHAKQIWQDSICILGYYDNGLLHMLSSHNDTAAPHLNYVIISNCNCIPPSQRLEWYIILTKPLCRCWETCQKQPPNKLNKWSPNTVVPQWQKTFPIWFDSLSRIVICWIKPHFHISMATFNHNDKSFFLQEWALEVFCTSQKSLPSSMG